jgi:hypothetical protein
MHEADDRRFGSTRRDEHGPVRELERDYGRSFDRRAHGEDSGYRADRDRDRWMEVGVDASYGRARFRGDEGLGHGGSMDDGRIEMGDRRFERRFGERPYGERQYDWRPGERQMGERHMGERQWTDRGERLTGPWGERQMSQRQYGESPMGERRYPRGPKGYRRSDERVREDVCDRLHHLGDIDSSDVEVKVQNGEVILTGSVPDRWMKYQIETISEHISGVNDVTNQIRVRPAHTTTWQGQQTETQQPENGRRSGGSGAMSRS